MGTGFTIDTPLKVARYGIDSVVSLVDDRLIEAMRERYCPQVNESYVPITPSEKDYRALRITAYLDLMDRIVREQTDALRASPFEADSEITKYFELLDDNSALKREYRSMKEARDGQAMADRQARLRRQVTAGSIDVNIMTKLDRETSRRGVKLPKEFAEAMSALRGFASSKVSGSVVLSAGLNVRLYSYIAAFRDFFPNALGVMRKKVVLKVSDFRSALIQGKVLAKRGIWVSEFRIESGLNCGGHAFPTAGLLLGTTLEEFRERRDELTEELFGPYSKALAKQETDCASSPPPTRITVQGGIGTAEEDRFLMRHYELDGTGWGTPFLLVPEVAAVDAATLPKLQDAGEDDVILSHVSPLGVPFYTLRNSASEEARRRRIASGSPGSACFNRHAALNNEFGGEALCPASSKYQAKKIAELEAKGLAPEKYRKAYDRIVEKACICFELGHGALLKHGISLGRKEMAPAICPGPNLAYFSRIAKLKEMIDHIYGRANLLSHTYRRPHVFIKELGLYVDYLKDLVAQSLSDLSAKQTEYLDEFRKNLQGGIEYYQERVNDIYRDSAQHLKGEFLMDLARLRLELEAIVFPEEPDELVGRHHGAPAALPAEVGA